jgi:hypothetical protein
MAMLSLLSVLADCLPFGRCLPAGTLVEREGEGVDAVYR